MARLGLLLFALGALAVSGSDGCGSDLEDEVCMLQLRQNVQAPSVGTGSKEKAADANTLAMIHVPFNFGNTIAAVVAFGSNNGIPYMEISGAAKEGWGKTLSLARAGGEFWGPSNPDLVAMTEFTGNQCPLYYTPGHGWPLDVAQKYFGDKTRFGMLRDPYERTVAVFKGMAPDEYKETCDVNGWIKMQLGEYDHDSNPFVLDCQLLPQADFFEGDFNVQEAVDMQTFPSSANKVLAEHGYHVQILTGDILHVGGCDDVWAGSLNEESLQLIEKVYAKDLELNCKHFGRCSRDTLCLRHIPGMCPPSLFTWDAATATWMPKAPAAIQAASGVATGCPCDGCSCSGGEVPDTAGSGAPKMDVGEGPAPAPSSEGPKMQLPPRHR